MEDAFRTVIERVFNNWTALQLSVEHSTNNQNSKQIVEDFVNYMIQFCCYENNIDDCSIQEALEDILDQEFDAICEDDSTREVSIILYKFTQLIRAGNEEAFTVELAKLPVNSGCINSQQCPSVEVPHEEPENVAVPQEKQPEAMEQDPEWTEVKSRRKK